MNLATDKMETNPIDQPQTKRVLALVFGGVEEVEVLAPVDLLRRAGIEVVMASVGEALEIEGRNGIRFLADQSLTEVDPANFDLLFLPGGPGTLSLIGDPLITDLIHSFDRKSKKIAAICAAPKVLSEAGILEGKQATGHSSVRAELPHPSDERIVTSDHIITSQGAGTAIEFGLKLVEILTNQTTAATVSASIHA